MENLKSENELLKSEREELKKDLEETTEKYFNLKDIFAEYLSEVGSLQESSKTIFESRVAYLKSLSE